MAFVLSRCQKDVPRWTAIWVYVWRQGFLPEEDAGIEARIPRARSGHPRWWSTVARVSYGICSLIFGASHFIGLKMTVQMIPT